MNNKTNLINTFTKAINTTSGYYYNGYIWTSDKQGNVQVYRRYYMSDVALNCDYATFGEYERSARLGEKI